MTSRKRIWIRATLWIGLAGAAVWLWYRASHRIHVVAPEQAPLATELVLVDDRGRTVVLSELRGRVVVIHLWARSCSSCRVEISRLTRVYRDFRGRGLIVLGVNVEGLPSDRLAALKRAWEIPYPLAVPLRPPEEGGFGGEGVVPHTWLVDRQGRVRASRAGLASEHSLRAAVRELVAEPGR